MKNLKPIVFATTLALLSLQPLITSAAPPTYRVYGTREGLVGGRTANGHIITSHDHFCALPSSAALNTLGGRTYTVTIRNPANGRVASNVPQWDIGPWNLTDNYWHDPRVSKFSNIAVGTPAAQVQYNNRTSAENGMVPANPAGIDIADGTFWDDLGMTDNGWVEVTYNWEDVGINNTHGPDAVSWGSGRIDVVVLGANNDIFHKSYVSGSGWSGYENLGGNSQSSPSICSWGSGRLDIFTRGGDDTLIHKWYVSGSGWSGWESLGGTLTGGPDATCWGSGRIDVVVRGANNVLFHKSFVSGTGWSSYENIGGDATSDPSICSWGSGRLDIFVRSGSANALYHKSFSSGWSGWENLGGTLTSGPDAACWGSGRIDIVARSSNNVMYHKYYQSGSGFSAWENIGGTSTSTPGVSSWGSGRLDVFIRGTDGGLWHKFFGPTWGSWEGLGGNLQ